MGFDSPTVSLDPTCQGSSLAVRAENTHLSFFCLSLFILKMINLPRQAWDRHRKTTLRENAVSAGWEAAATVGAGR
jgi:hypothetical protein